MPTTPNHGIFYADTSTNASLASITSTMASSVESALDTADTNLEKYGITQVANYAALTAFTNYVTGTRVYVIDEKTTYLKQASGWIPWDSNWLTWSNPISSGLTVGTGTVARVVPQYRYTGGMVHAEFAATLGEGSFSVGSITLTLPVPAPSRNTGSAVRYGMPGTVVFYDYSATARYIGDLATDSLGATVILSAVNAGGTYATRTVTSSTVPFTWNTADTIFASFVYTPDTVA